MAQLGDQQEGTGCGLSVGVLGGKDETGKGNREDWER